MMCKMNKIMTKVDSISFINYTTKTLHAELNAYCRIHNLTKHYIETNTYTKKHVYKKNNNVIFVYKTKVDKEGYILNFIEFNGLVTYQSDIDKAREENISDVLEYLSVHSDAGRWSIRQLDICSDLSVTNDKVIVTKKRVKGNRLDSLDCNIGFKTQYIETIKRKQTDKGIVLDRSNMLVSSYLYDKTLKERIKHNNIIDEVMTRFEVKILPRMFKRICHISDVKDIAGKYTINVYKTKSRCDVDKVLINNKKAFEGGLWCKLGLQGIEDFLCSIERWITLDITDKRNCIEFCLEDFM